MPRLRISDFYREMADNGAGNSSLTQEYIQEKIKAGNWLMKSIEQRQKTILRVTRSILKHQYDFFERGINSLRPLVLKDVAEDIDVHESTVSRITTNKYAHTPQGIFELKYFFTSGIDQGQGEVISSKKIKDMILRIISAEDAREPLTDIQIAERLSNVSKIKVARRTVAKYREALNLLPSNKRKKMF
jgi:RNA polymerase sigma-54 factor